MRGYPVAKPREVKKKWNAAWKQEVKGRSNSAAWVYGN
jgi:hypothetical protein